MVIVFLFFNEQHRRDAGGYRKLKMIFTRIDELKFMNFNNIHRTILGSF